MAAIPLGSAFERLWHIIRHTAMAMIVFVVAACGFSQEEVKRIPLESMYATQPHDGMKRLSLASADADTVEHFMGLSPWAWNVFLVRAEHLSGATIAALRFREITQMSAPQDGKGQPWLVVYFGFASSDAQDWTIQSVEQSDSRIVVTYNGPRKDIVRTAGASPAFVLIPLPEMPARSYQLELRHSVTKRVTLMRKTQVGAAGK